MKKTFFYFLLSFIFIFIATCFAEDITITTYYPAPYGVYKQLRLSPTDDFVPGGACLNNKGTMYYDDSESKVYVCDGNIWQVLGGYWSLSGTNLYTNDVGLGQNWNVGIGTTTPVSKLVVKGTTADNTASALNVINNSMPTPTSLLFVRNDGYITIGNNLSPELTINSDKFYLKDGGTGSAEIRFFDSTPNDEWRVGTGSDDPNMNYLHISDKTIVDEDNRTAMIFRRYGNPLDATGTTRVGIGVWDPQHKLDVDGGVSALEYWSGSSNTQGLDRALDVVYNVVSGVPQRCRLTFSDGLLTNENCP
ncbi:MAG: hypothetical protein Q8O13_10120 [Candidatus Omnitrophota bacterium]|nr:hypothetical protein [Candidatus Omnitrophota bacterium]